MATVDQFIATAKKYVGTKEDPPGSNRTIFAAKAGHTNGLSWCATFCVAVAREASVSLPSESPYTPTMADGFRRTSGWYPTSPKPGDLVFFDFPDATYRIQHVGIVTTILGDATIRTVEGNTSSGTYGSQDNGGGVFERTRPLSYVKGFGRPSFDKPVLTVADEEVEVGAVFTRAQGGWAVAEHDGGVFCYDGAPFLGSVPGRTDIKLGGNIISGLWNPNGDGYWLFASDGAVYAFGKAPYFGGFNSFPATTRGGRWIIGALANGTGYSQIARDPSHDNTPHDRYDFLPK